MAFCTQIVAFTCAQIATQCLRKHTNEYGIAKFLILKSVHCVVLKIHLLFVSVSKCFGGLFIVSYGETFAMTLRTAFYDYFSCHNTIRIILLP